jgi:hypothetical protein
MYHDQRRTSPRDVLQAPILISEQPDGNYLNAIMCNQSKNGMYIVSQKPLICESGLYVNMLHGAHSDIYRGFFGRVKWCRELKRSSDLDDHFGIGINFVIRSHHYFGGIGMTTECCCDICGEKMPFEKLLKTKDYIFECPRCHDALDCYPEGSLKSSITNYLMGNIL